MKEQDGYFTLPSSWARDMAKAVATYHTGNRDLAAGLRVAILLSVPMLAGIYLGHTYAGLVGTLGVFSFSVVEVPGFHRKPQIKHLFVTGGVNSLAFAAGTLVGLAGIFSVPLLGIAFFTAAFLTSNNDAASTGLVACVVFSLGIGIPGATGPSSALSRLWLSYLGVLLAFSGFLVHSIVDSMVKKRRKAAGDEDALEGQTISYSALLRAEGSSNPVIRNEHLLFAVAFGAAGAAALAISNLEGISHGYWVLLTLALLLFRSDISTAMAFTLLRIIGTVIGAVIGVAAISFLFSPLSLLPVLCAAGGMFYAFRGLNFALGTVFITSFIIVLLDIPAPGSFLLAPERILDTLVAGAITTGTVIVLWAGGRWHSRFKKWA